MNNEMMRQELSEAITAGERALRSLKAAQEKLKSARNWGLYDMFGGGWISSAIKQNKFKDASYDMENAKRDLQIFQRELRDVHVSDDLRVEIGSFLSFADFFFDGFIADYMVQSKINDAREQVDDAMYRVENLLSDLRTQYRQV